MYSPKVGAQEEQLHSCRVKEHNRGYKKQEIGEFWNAGKRRRGKGAEGRQRRRRIGSSKMGRDRKRDANKRQTLCSVFRLEATVPAESSLNTRTGQREAHARHGGASRVLIMAAAQGRGRREREGHNEKKKRKKGRIGGVYSTVPAPREPDWSSRRGPWPP